MIACNASRNVCTLFLTVFLVFGVGSAQAVTLKLSTDSGTKDSPPGNAMDFWAEQIEEKSNGEITVDVYYQGELGGQQAVFDQHVMGQADLALMWPMTSYDERIGLLYTPYMFLSWESALDAYRPGGWAYQALDGIASDLGLRFVGVWPDGFAGVATKGKYARTVEEARDLKVRSMTVFPMPSTLETMGFQATAIPWDEIFTSIQTGVVDGDAANTIYWDYQFFKDTLDYYVRTKHVFQAATLTVSAETFDSLTDEQQQIIREAAAETMKEQFSVAKENDARYARKWEEAGNEYIELSDEEVNSFAARVRERIWPQLDERLGKELADKVRANAEPLSE